MREISPDNAVYKRKGLFWNVNVYFSVISAYGRFSSGQYQLRIRSLLTPVHKPLQLFLRLWPWIGRCFRNWRVHALCQCIALCFGCFYVQAFFSHVANLWFYGKVWLRRSALECESVFCLSLDFAVFELSFFFDVGTILWKVEGLPISQR